MNNYAIKLKTFLSKYQNIVPNHDTCDIFSKRPIIVYCILYTIPVNFKTKDIPLQDQLRPLECRDLCRKNTWILRNL